MELQQTTQFHLTRTGRGSRSGTSASLKVGLALGKELVDVLALKVGEESLQGLLINLTAGGGDNGGDLLSRRGLLAGNNKQSVSSDELHVLTKYMERHTFTCFWWDGANLCICLAVCSQYSSTYMHIKQTQPKLTLRMVVGWDLGMETHHTNACPQKISKLALVHQLGVFGYISLANTGFLKKAVICGCGL